MPARRKSKTNAFKVQVLSQPAIQTYLKNKQIGAKNFEKGGDYELQFAVSIIAKQLDSYLSQGVDPLISSQAPQFFVDDLVLNDRSSISCWQLKNQKKVHWGKGRKGSIGFDFAHQLKVPNIQPTLVVSCPKIADRLKNKMPAALKPTLVQYFMDAHLLEIVQEIEADLAKISNRTKPKLQLLYQIAKGIAVNWKFSGGNCHLSQLVDSELKKRLRTEKSKGDPQKQLRTGVKQILSEVPDLTYSVNKGFFECEYLDTDQCLAFDCFSPQFETVQDWIEQNSPKTYPGDFERMLTTWSVG